MSDLIVIFVINNIEKLLIEYIGKCDNYYVNMLCILIIFIKFL